MVSTERGMHREGVCGVVAMALTPTLTGVGD